MVRKIAIEWETGRPAGEIAVQNGRMLAMTPAAGTAECRGSCFAFTADGRCRLNLHIQAENAGKSGGRTVVFVRTRRQPFSFFLADIDSEYPVFIPAYGVAVTAADDPRSYAEIHDEIRKRQLRTETEVMEQEPEASYETASLAAKNIPRDILLGISRDIRVFSTGFKSTVNHKTFEQLDWIQPSLQIREIQLPESNMENVRYNFSFGRGLGCCDDVVKRLEDGVLPILHARIADGDMVYHVTEFVTLEKSELTDENIRGTPCLIASTYGLGSQLTAEQESELKRQIAAEPPPDEEVVLYYRIEAVNQARVPRYAWFAAPVPNGTIAPSNIDKGISCDYDREQGYSYYSPDRIFGITKLDGKAMPEPETAVLVKPGATAVFDLIIPHQPVSRERATALFNRDFQAKKAECRAFWQKKLDAAAKLHVPERRIDEMLASIMRRSDQRAPRWPCIMTLSAGMARRKGCWIIIWNGSVPTGSSRFLTPTCWKQAPSSGRPASITAIPGIRRGPGESKTN